MVYLLKMVIVHNQMVILLIADMFHVIVLLSLRFASQSFNRQ